MKNLAAILLLAAGCADQVSDGSFHVAGRVQSTATHVIASTADAAHVVAAVDRDHHFEMALAPKHAWALSFADATQAGPAMLVAVFQSDTLDTLAPQDQGEVDLGTVALADGVATASLSRALLLDAMNLDEATAQRIGEVDDLATRFATPDVDGDGVIDALQDGHDFRIDLHGDMHLQLAGRDLGITDLLQPMADGVGVDYAGTGIEVRLPAGFAMSQMTTAAMRFEQPFYGTSQGADTPVVPAGTPIGEPELLAGATDGRAIAAVYARPGYDVPSGTYEFGAGAMTLTFEGVRAPSNGSLAAGTGFVVPLVRVVPAEDGCTSDCVIASIDYQWMQRTATGWQPAADAELAMMPAARVDVVRLRVDGSSQDMQLSVPTAHQSGSLPWLTATTAPGMMVSDLAGVTTGQICYVGVGYRDLVGTRLTSMIQNPALACANLR